MVSLSLITQMPPVDRSSVLIYGVRRGSDMRPSERTAKPRLEMGSENPNPSCLRFATVGMSGARNLRASKKSAGQYEGSPEMNTSTTRRTVA